MTKTKNPTANILDPVQDTLDQRVFKGDEPRQQLVKYISKHFFSEMANFVPHPEKYFDLYLTGSITTYQYSDSSDIDISVIPHYDEIVKATGLPDANAVRKQLIRLVIDKLDGRIAPGTPHTLQHFVVPPGTTIQDLFKPGLRSAWSFKNKQWVVPPEKERAHDIKRELPGLYLRAENIAEKMKIALDTDPGAAKKLFHRIHKKRSEDQQRGYGDFSEGNIIYKYLLHEGLFDRIRDELGEYIAARPYSWDEDWVCPECGETGGRDAIYEDPMGGFECRKCGFPITSKTSADPTEQSTINFLVESIWGSRGDIEKVRNFFVSNSQLGTEIWRNEMVDRAAEIYKQQHQQNRQQFDELKQQQEEHVNQIGQYRWAYYNGRIILQNVDKNHGGDWFRNVHYDMLQTLLGGDEALFGPDGEGAANPELVPNLYLGYADVHYDTGEVDTLGDQSWDYGGMEEGSIPSDVQEQIANAIRADADIQKTALQERNDAIDDIGEEDSSAFIWLDGKTYLNDSHWKILMDHPDLETELKEYGRDIFDSVPNRRYLGRIWSNGSIENWTTEYEIPPEVERQIQDDFFAQEPRMASDFDTALVDPLRYTYIPLGPAEMVDWPALSPDDKERWRRIADGQNARANKLGVPSGVIGEQLHGLAVRYQGNCAYCGGPKANSWEHVVPLSAGGGSTVDNMLPVHQQCNSDMNSLDNRNRTEDPKGINLSPNWLKWDATPTAKISATERLFLAFELPDNIVQQVMDWQQTNMPEGVFPEPATNLHMTVAFLGDTDTEMIPALQQILAEIDPSSVSLSGPIEYRELDKLAFLALQDSGGNEIVEHLNLRLNELMGYTPQFQPWLPHITVWRFAPDHKPNIQPELPNFGSFSPLAVNVYTSIKNPAGRGGIYQKVADTDRMHIIYDFEKDRIILGMKNSGLPNTIVVGTYHQADGSAILNETANQWINAKYFKKLWRVSFPTYPLRVVHFHSKGVSERIGATIDGQEVDASDIRMVEAFGYVGEPYNELLDSGTLEHYELMWDFTEKHNVELEDLLKNKTPIILGHLGQCELVDQEHFIFYDQYVADFQSHSLDDMNDANDYPQLKQKALEELRKIGYKNVVEVTGQVARSWWTVNF